MSLWLQGRRAHPNPILQHGQKYFSQSDEDGILLEVLRRIEPTSGICAEIGCGDGLENSTLNLLARGWRTIWIDAAPLAFNPNYNPELLAHSREFVTAETAVDLIRSGQKKLGVAQPDVLSIDVDGNDGYLVRALLEAGILASVVVIEMNEVIPPQLNSCNRMISRMYGIKRKTLGGVSNLLRIYSLNTLILASPAIFRSG
jgi:hypothetical protein